VPVALRERLRAVASATGQTFGEVIEEGLGLVERERFWDRVGAIQPDAAYLAEFATWEASADGAGA
jgi:hypothetical protein